MNVGQGHCMGNCGVIITDEVNTCQRAFLLLENVSMSLNSSFIETMCNQETSAHVEVNFQCCPPLDPTNCNITGERGISIRYKLLHQVYK